MRHQAPAVLATQVMQVFPMLEDGVRVHEFVGKRGGAGTGVSELPGVGPFRLCNGRSGGPLRCRPVGSIGGGGRAPATGVASGNRGSGLSMEAAGCRVVAEMGAMKTLAHMAVIAVLTVAAALVVLTGILAVAWGSFALFM